MAFDPNLSARRVSRSGKADDDVALLRRVAAGEGWAIDGLYRRHATAVYRYAWLVTGSESAAADAVHDTFVALLDRASGFDPARGSCVAWLCGIARHLALRSSVGRLETVGDITELADRVQQEGGGVQPVLPEPPLEAAERKQAVANLYEAIRALPVYFRDVLILAELQQMSYAEVAQVTGIELGTVRSRLARARALLAAHLQQAAVPVAAAAGRVHR